MLLAFGVPIAALLISLFIVYPAWGRYGEQQDRITHLQAELSALKAAPVPPPVRTQPAADDTPAESSQFLGQMNRAAAGAQCALISLDAASVASSKAGSAKDPSEVRAVRARIVVEGPFRQIRSLLWELQHGTRLFVVTDLSLAHSASGSNKQAGQATETDGRVRATIGLERYVAPALHAMPVQTASAAK
jgi:hypothetical protein